jgi:hypothetical protein
MPIKPMRQASRFHFAFAGRLVPIKLSPLLLRNDFLSLSKHYPISIADARLVR